MKNNKLASAISAVFITSVLSACGGGGSSVVGATPAAAAKVTSSGVISEYGSIVVNGVHYKTETSSIVSADDGTVLVSNPTNAEVQTLLGLGQVVKVRGERNDDNITGTATTISLDNELNGTATVTTVSEANGSFVILGQTISLTPDTIIDDSLIEAVRGGDLPADLKFGDATLTETLSQRLDGKKIVVSGFPSQNGFEATRIEGNTTLAVGDVEIKGEVKTLIADTSFFLNNLKVLIDTSTTGSSLLAAGKYVEVHGSATANSTTASPEILATSIELEDNHFDDDFTEGEIEVEGVIQKIVAATSGTGGTITINGIDITVNDVSLFSEGLRVEVKGSLQSDGTITVSRIKDEAEDTIRTKDLVASSNATSFTTRLGLVVTPSDRSRLENDTIDNDDDLSTADFLTNINGKRIEARGFPINGSTTWTRLEIEKAGKTDCQLRGAVETGSIDATNFTFTIDGVTIDASNVSEANFEDGSGLSIGKTAFFAEMSEGDIVQAKSDKAGTGCTSGLLTARGVEFEPQDSVLLGSPADGNNGVIDNELVGSVSNITATTFDVAGVTITVNDATKIDNSIIEDARGVESVNDETFGSITETLAELLSGKNVEVVVDRTSGVVAVSIEDR